MNGLPEVDDATSVAAPSGPGTERSFEDFYAGSASRLITQLYLVTGDQEEARDCAQEAFARAWLRWDTLSRDSLDPFGWVYTVGYRVAVSRFRRRMTFQRALRRTTPLPDVPGPAPEIIAVRDALATLPQGQRAALVLHYYEGMPVEAIAGVLGVGASAVKSRLARGRAALAPLLGEEAAR